MSMSVRRILISTITLVIVLAFSYLRLSLEAEAGSLTTVLSSFGFEPPSAIAIRSMADVEKTLHFWQARAANNPNDLLAYSKLGEYDLVVARHSGDVSYYQRAEAALRRALEIAPAYRVARVHLMTALFAQHRFNEALDLAERLYAEDPGSLPALATIGDAQLSLGNYAAAEAAFGELADQNHSAPVYSRLAALAALYGRPDEAIQQMTQAVEAARQNGGYQEEVAWYPFQLGELYFNQGQLKEAEKQYRTALQIYPDYYLALAGLGKVKAAQGDYEAAIEDYTRATNIIPQPDLLAALGDLYRLAGRPDDAQRQYETVEYIGRLAELNEQVYNRQLAYFYADHNLQLDQAAALATAELEARRDILGYDVAAWTLYKIGRYDQAQAMIEQAMQLGTRDARLYYHAGLIAQAHGQASEAERLLAEALAINPYFDPIQASIARAVWQELQAK